MKHVVMFSGGIGSWAAAKRVAEQHGSDNLYLLFSDVKGSNPNPHIGEDEDTYRFIDEAAKNVGGQLVTVSDGRDIWEVFKDKRFLGNSRIAPCSHLLKQRPSKKWVEENCDPEDTTIYVGIDWSEIHRLPSIEKNYLPYSVKAPLTEYPYLDKDQLFDWAEREGLTIPRLYGMGFFHNNCGGGCVRAGQGQFKNLLQVMPERFKVWEDKEQELREYLDKDVSILKKMTNGVIRNFTLKELREKYQEGTLPIDKYDIGGCNCFTDYEEEEE